MPRFTEGAIYAPGNPTAIDFLTDYSLKKNILAFPYMSQNSLQKAQERTAERATNATRKGLDYILTTTEHVPLLLEVFGAQIPNIVVLLDKGEDADLSQLQEKAGTVKLEVLQRTKHAVQPIQKEVFHNVEQNSIAEARVGLVPTEEAPAPLAPTEAEPTEIIVTTAIEATEVVPVTGTNDHQEAAA